MVKNALAVGALPGPRWGGLHCSPFSTIDGRGSCMCKEGERRGKKKEEGVWTPKLQLLYPPVHLASYFQHGNGVTPFYVNSTTTVHFLHSRRQDFPDFIATNFTNFVTKLIAYIIHYRYNVFLRKQTQQQRLTEKKTD